MKAIKLNTNRWSSGAIKIVGLWLVAVLLVVITDHKLDRLRDFQNTLPLGVASIDDKMRQLECLTRNIYWEAASEPFEGKVAVAQVTLNRVASGRWPDSVCAVVHQKNIVYEKVICQFSWYCENTHKFKAVYTPLWRESEEVAKRVLFEGFRLPSLRQAYYFHAEHVSPGWNKPRLEKIGRHIFYGERS